MSCKCLCARVDSTLTSWVLQLPNLSHFTAQTHRPTWTHAMQQKMLQLWRHLCQNVDLVATRELLSLSCGGAPTFNNIKIKYKISQEWEVCMIFYEHKRKHSHKFWQGESMSWLVRLGERKKRGDKRQQGLWLGTRTGIEGSSTYINHSLLIHPFILWDNVQAGPWLGSC